MAKITRGRQKELPLGSRQRQYALAVMLRNEDVFAAAKEHLLPTTLDTAESTGMGLVWQTLKEYQIKHEKMPTQEVLMAELEHRLSVMADVDDEVVETIDEFMALAYALQPEELDSKIALHYISKMLTEQAQAALMHEIVNSVGVVTDLPELLQQHVVAAEAAKSVTSGKAPLPFPETPDEITAVVLEKTGVSFLDMYMNGGMARKEVNGFCGPFGSCKTTLGLQLAVEKARASLKIWRDGGCVGLPQRVYYFSWEEDLKQLQPRILSYAARIHLSSFQNIENKDFKNSLSRRTTTPKDYEKREFKDQLAAGVFLGEYERMENAMKELNLVLRVIDFTGATSEYRESSKKLVPGMVEVIKKDQQMSSNPGVALVVVDYAGAAAEAAILGGLHRRDDLRHLIGKMPLHLKQLIAAPMNCQVWCLQQLGTVANSREAGIAPKSTDSAEAKNFFENVNFGFMVGKPNKENLTVFTNGKQRRAARREDIIVFINGAFGSVEDVSKRYLISDNTILDRAEAHQIVRENQRHIIRDDNVSSNGIGID